MLQPAPAGSWSPKCPGKEREGELPARLCTTVFLPKPGMAKLGDSQAIHLACSGPLLHPVVAIPPRTSALSCRLHPRKREEGRSLVLLPSCNAKAVSGEEQSPSPPTVEMQSQFSSCHWLINILPRAEGERGSDSWLRATSPCLASKGNAALSSGLVSPKAWK